MVELVHRLHPRNSKMAKLVYGLHQESPKKVELEVGLHHGCPGSDYRSLGVVMLVIRLHHGSPRMVKLEVGLHQGCFIKDQKVSRGGETSDGASPPKMQDGKVHDGTLPWKFQGV